MIFDDMLDTAEGISPEVNVIDWFLSTLKPPPPFQEKYLVGVDHSSGEDYSARVVVVFEDDVFKVLGAVWVK